MFKVLLATDGSEHSGKTVAEAAKIIASLQGEITVLSVVEDIPVSEYYKASKAFESYDPAAIDKIKKSLSDAEASLENTARIILEKTESIFMEKGISVKTLLKKGHPADIICSVAEDGNFDLVIIGSRGLGGLKELILGSVSNKVAHCVKKSVLIVK